MCSVLPINTIVTLIKGLVLEDKPAHTSSHTLRPVRKKLTELPTATADLDYLFQNNYLDSNFVN